MTLLKLSKKQRVQELKDANRRLKQDVERMRRERDVIAQQLTEERGKEGGCQGDGEDKVRSLGCVDALLLAL